MSSNSIKSSNGSRRRSDAVIKIGNSPEYVEFKRHLSSLLVTVTPSKAAV
jgi:hypothetical protein